MRQIATSILISLTLVTPALACGFHEGAGILNVPNHPGVMITLARVNAAKDVELIPLSKKPDAMLNWQLAQKLSSTMPVEKIVFYQVNEGHYSFVTKDNYRWLQEYTLDKKPKLGELMILSELSVFDALFERSISIDTALSEMWIKINGPKRERELVTEWLRENFA